VDKNHPDLQDRRLTFLCWHPVGAFHSGIHLSSFVVVWAVFPGVVNMKRVLIGASLLLIVFAMAGLRPGKAQQTSAAQQEANNGAPPPANPLKVAILHWYQANMTASFKVGKQPYAVAFDGQSMWSANYEDGTVTKLRASDGEILGTFPVGEEPDTLAFDGENMWVGNYGGASVTKLRASDGKNLGTFTTGGGPFGMTFDGENIWVGNSLVGTVTKLRATDGKNLGTFNLGGANALAFDGTYIWVTGGNTVTRLKKDGTQAGTFNVGSGPFGIAFDGANMWIPNNSSGSVTKLRAKDGANLGTFSLGGDSPWAVAFDGEDIWVTGTPDVFELRASDGAILDKFHDPPGSFTEGVAFDGANIWLALPYDNALGKF
jgi:hypothetical protein